MLKGFKLKKESSSFAKGRITSADISGPSQEKGNSGIYMNRLRSLSNTSLRGVKNNGGGVSPSNEVPIILKALYTYHAQSPGELSFTKGELVHVIGEDGEWFEVSSPDSGRKGMVPKSYFEPVSRSRVVSTQSILVSPQQAMQSVKAGSLYAIVLYDFKAEKSDELSAFAGENLFICAHHNYEWFIAKPIGRLGGPGLVPVGFVSIIDINTGYATGNNVTDDIESVNLPTVQEWKSNIAKYKASNISLGSVEHQGRTNSSMNPTSSQPHKIYPTMMQTFEQLVVVNAAVESFLLEGEKYWFHVVCDLDDGSSHSLKRYYEDFYDLQVQLLDTYPAEAGKLRDSGGQWTKRIMPYIPGPVPYVTDSITKKRKDDLNIYVKELITLPPHISQSALVNSLFAIKNNGFDRLLPNENFGSNLERDNDDTVALNKPRIGLQEESTLTGTDLKRYEKMGDMSLNDANISTRPTSLAAAPPPIKPTKIKFYYKDDIFALLLSPDITLEELKKKIAPRIDSEKFQIFIRADDDVATEIISDEQVIGIIQERLKITVLDA
ncbi:phosphatidylinositol-3-phosphate-binding protein BEM1 Ecym_1167 [Eremothecium cymbalariae DBVPG|uniref:Bud emergence protein 1 n=1 Tax=Eremothecium cymbalariae (strain CBS 270.75 / DBVPG 7215 / KCTC 17166 / NRRL Y-17582) TaxID=931890 RepID=G8JMV3_ERECY|nr:hypothetical protein Ecym_1167 [Eremothecium cymbalariae DBVPG\